MQPACETAADVTVPLAFSLSFRLVLSLKVYFQVSSFQILFILSHSLFFTLNSIYLTSKTKPILKQKPETIA